MRAAALQVSGGVLEAGWWGPDPTEAPTVVLLHEGLGSVALWRDVPQRLAATTGWGVFAYSRFGYGNSDITPLPRPMTYMHHEAQVVLPEVLRGAGIQRAVLVGHSDGGSIAAIYAGTASRPGEFALPADEHQSDSILPSPRLGLEFSSTHSSSRPARSNNMLSSSWAGASRRSAHEEPGAGGADNTNRVHLLGLVTIAAHFFVEDLNIASIHEIAASYETGDLRQRLARYHRNAEVAFRGWCDAWMDPRFRAFDITGFLPAIQVPVLALQGADDPYGTDQQLKIFAANVQAPIETRLIPDARHSPHLEAKDATLAAISDFIAGLQRGFPT